MAEVAAAAERQAKEQAKIEAHRPSFDDYRREGVIDHVPEPGPDGVPRIQVQGHDKVVRMLQMNERMWAAESEVADAREAEQEHVPIRGRGGERQYVRESQAERRERKHFVPRCSITVPALPWKER